MTKPRPRPDWTALRARYAADPTLSLEALAGEAGVHPSTVKERAAKEGWTEDRRTFQEERRQSLQEALAGELEEFDLDRVRRLVALSRGLLDRLEASLEDGELRPSVLDLVRLGDHLQAVRPDQGEDGQEWEALPMVFRPLPPSERDAAKEPRAAAAPGAGRSPGSASPYSAR